jgi:hypothetical protein
MNDERFVSTFVFQKMLLFLQHNQQWTFISWLLNIAWENSRFFSKIKTWKFQNQSIWLEQNVNNILVFHENSWIWCFCSYNHFEMHSISVSFIPELIKIIDLSATITTKMMNENQFVLRIENLNEYTYKNPQENL